MNVVGWNTVAVKIVRWAQSQGLRPLAVIAYGSATVTQNPRDIDVLVFLPYDSWIAKNPHKISELEIDLRAYWNAWAEPRGLPALDPLILLGYKPLVWG